MTTDNDDDDGKDDYSIAYCLVGGSQNLVSDVQCDTVQYNAIQCKGVVLHGRGMILLALLRALTPTRLMRPISSQFSLSLSLGFCLFVLDPLGDPGKQAFPRYTVCLLPVVLAALYLVPNHNYWYSGGVQHLHLQQHC